MPKEYIHEHVWGKTDICIFTNLELQFSISCNYEHTVVLAVPVFYYQWESLIFSCYIRILQVFQNIEYTHPLCFQIAVAFDHTQRSYLNHE